MTIATLRSGIAAAMAALLAGGMLTTAAWAGKANAVKHYDKAVRLVDGGQWDAALDELKSAVEENPRSGEIKIGMFRTLYYPYFQMARAYLGKRDFKAAEKYFSMEESEGKIQKDTKLYAQFLRERGEAQSASGGSTAPAAPETADKTVSSGGGAGTGTAGSAGQGSIPPGLGGVPGPLPPTADSAALLEEARAAGERLGSFEVEQAASLGAADRQKLTDLRQTLDAAIQSNDPTRLKGAGAGVDKALARLRVRLAGDFLKKRASFMSRDQEEALRSLSEQVERAAAAEDAAALPEAAKQLDERLGQARQLADRAIAAVRAAFAGAAEGDNDKAIRALEEALAAQADCPALRLILARFYFEAAAERQDKGGGAMDRAREQAAQAFRLRPDLNLPERYFSPEFLDLVRQASGRKSSKKPAGPKPAAPAPS